MERIILRRLLACAHAVDVALTYELNCHRSTARQFLALETIASFGTPAPISSLARKFNCSRAATSQIVQRLLACGSVKLYDDPEDRRVRCLVLTEVGQTTLASGREATDRVLTELLRAVSAEDREALMRCFDGIQRGISLANYERSFGRPSKSWLRKRR